MKRLAIVTLLAVLATTAATLPASTRADKPEETVPFFNTIVLDEGQEASQDIVSIGGRVVIRGHQRASVVVIGGSLELDGQVDEDVVAVLSDVTIAEGAVVGGDFVTVLTDIEGSDVRVGGDRVFVPSPVSWLPRGVGPFRVFASIFAGYHALRAVLTLLLVVLFALLLPGRIAVLADETSRSYGIAMLLGFVLHLLVLTVVLALATTVIAIPMAILLQLAFWVVRMIGRAGLFCSMGRGLLPGGERASLLAAVLLGFVPWAVLTVAPFFFGLIGLVFGLLLVMLVHVVIDWPAVGLLALTRFGEQNRPASPGTAPPASPAGP